MACAPPSPDTRWIILLPESRNCHFSGATPEQVPAVNCGIARGRTLTPCASRRDQAAFAAMLGGLKASLAKVRGGATEKTVLLTGGAASKTSTTLLGWIAPRASSNTVRVMRSADL